MVRTKKRIFQIHYNQTENNVLYLGYFFVLTEKNILYSLKLLMDKTGCLPCSVIEQVVLDAAALALIPNLGNFPACLTLSLPSFL